ncbi:MAG: hypothetical protein IJ136_05225 [Erysipelotrichaceae bacterium]|nr:hypothetical protein [Erysipelotrichaceae bacterium]
MENLKFYNIEQGDKYFISVKDGGYSRCIRPQDYKDGVSFFPGSVLANCVGLACGAFNKNIAHLTGIEGMKYPLFNCNAEDFIERLKKVYPDLIVSQVPVPGGMMVWRGKGDLAGHVCYINDFKDNVVYTAESSYGGSVFYNKERTNGNGRWGMSGSYDYLGCINPSIRTVVSVDPDNTKDQVKVNIDKWKLNVRLSPSLQGEIYCCITETGYYNVYGISKADGYTWYKISEDGKYIANLGTEYYPASAEDDLIKQLEKFMIQTKTAISTLKTENATLTKDNAVLSEDVKKFKEAIKQIAEISNNVLG